MISKYQLNILLLLGNLIGFTQTFKEIKKFPLKQLPIVIDYSLDEQKYYGAIYHTDTLKIQGEDSTELIIEEVYETSVYKKDSTLLLSEDFVKTYLLFSNESLYHQEDWDQGDSIINQFYAVGSIKFSKSYTGIIYERFYILRSFPNSEKYLCILDAQHHLVSKLKIASFIFGGWGIGYSGGKVPWFPFELGTIQKDLHILIHHSQGDPDTLFKLDVKGNIIPLN